ncbi:MAG: adenylyltransferase/cytidyltransferase family protein [Bacilli bacterium]|nr:adenylyltransferase/cytidyltransferase family protein [Bacilli bacterium]
MLDAKTLQILENARKSGKIIGLVQGSWDLFHVGHLKYIRKAMRRCDFLVIGMDSDEKIRKRKGPGRPIIPEVERREMLEELGFADIVVTKGPDEPKWGLIRAVRPDVLIAISENYKLDDIPKLESICGRVEILPRQSESSTSDAVRKAQIASKTERLDERVLKVVEDMKIRNGLTEEMNEPLSLLFEHLKYSTDWINPVSATCFVNGKWYVGNNKVDKSIPKYDLNNRTELFYSTTEHAEINLLKQLDNVTVIDTPVWVTLFPCDTCMKVLNDKGVKQIYYLEDHPERNWSKRSHLKALEYGISTTPILTSPALDVDNNIECSLSLDSNYKYVSPLNVRAQEQLDIMIRQEADGIDPLDPKVLANDILFWTDFWYVTKNKFPIKGAEYQILISAYNPVYKLEDMSLEMWIDLMSVWMKLINDYQIPGGALGFRFGETLYSGASLKRIHAHLIKPMQGEKSKFTIGGNKELRQGLVLRLKPKTNN